LIVDFASFPIHSTIVERVARPLTKQYKALRSNSAVQLQKDNYAQIGAKALNTTKHTEVTAGQRLAEAAKIHFPLSAEFSAT
jgi:hypothetical protein